MNRPTAAQFIEAMRAHGIPAGERGPWQIRKAGGLTALHHVPANETVMLDGDFELRTHLQPAVLASGTVLVGGLGLGCVVRGLLLNPAVTSVLVVERDPDVLELVAPFMPRDPRLQIEQADLREWARRDNRTFDLGWIDLWTHEAEGEPWLSSVHSECIAALAGRVGRIGAWAFPRPMRRMFREVLPAML